MTLSFHATTQGSGVVIETPNSLPPLSVLVASYNDDGTFAGWLDPTAGGGGGHVIEDDGTPVAQRDALNFAGAGVVVTDDAVNDATVITIAGGAGGTPGGTDGQVQFNNAGAFGGFGDWDGGTFTLTPPANATGLQITGTAPEGPLIKANLESGTTVLEVDEQGSLHVIGNDTVAVSSFVSPNSGIQLNDPWAAVEFVNTDQTVGNWVKFSFSDAISGPAVGVIGAQISDHALNFGSLSFSSNGAGNQIQNINLYVGESGLIGINTVTPSPLQGSGGLTIASAGNPELVLERTAAGTEAFASLRVTGGGDLAIAVKDGASPAIDAVTVFSDIGGVRLSVAAGAVGFYGTTPIAKQTGVAVDAASIHAALVALGLIGP